MTQPAPIVLKNRSCTVTVGTTQITNIAEQKGLDVWFTVRRSLKPGEPNTCDLRIYNLSDDSRKSIEAAAQPLPQPGGGASTATATPVEIVAGYDNATSTIFLGEMRAAQTVTDGPDTVTELTTGDGDQAMVLSRSTTCFGAGANAYNVALQLLGDAKIGQGNIITVATTLRSAKLYQKGVVLKGNSWDHLVDLARGCGLEVSVQSGVAQWTSLGQPLPGQAYSLSSDSGLIGSPTVDTKGVLSCEVLMLPGLQPGSPIVLDAKYVKGQFRIVSMETVGDVSGNDWVHRIEAKRIGLVA